MTDVPRPLRVVLLGRSGSRVTEAARKAVAAALGARLVKYVDADEVGPLHDLGSADAVEVLAESEPDLLFSAGYTRILSPRTLGVARVGAVNLHPSLLPAYRGSHPIFWAYYHGERTVGATLHEMVPAVDAGGLVTQVEVAIDPWEPPALGYQRVLDAAAPGIACAVARIAVERRLHVVSQRGTPSYRNGPDRELDRLCIDVA